MSDKANARDAARYARERHETDVEHRTTLAPVTLRAKGEGDSGQTFEGYAVKYNSRTWIGYGPDDPWGFWEQVSTGAFDVSLRTADVVCVYNHDLNYMLGRTASGTLRLSSDDTGLLAVNDLPDTTVGRDLGVLVARKDVAGMSFSFIPTEENWTVQKDGTDLRTLITSDIFDVAPCVLPAYGDTTAAVRAVQLGRRNAPRPFTDDERTARALLAANGGDIGGEHEEITGDDGTIGDPEDWADIQRDMGLRLMIERERWYL
jgi:HK97 family phage prohead protease